MAIIAQGKLNPSTRTVTIPLRVEADKKVWITLNDQNGEIEVLDTNTEIPIATKIQNTVTVEQLCLYYGNWNIKNWRPSKPLMEKNLSMFAIEQMSEDQLIKLMNEDDQWEEGIKTTGKPQGCVWMHRNNLYESFAYSDVGRMKAWLKYRLKQIRQVAKSH